MLHRKTNIYGNSFSKPNAKQSFQTGDQAPLAYPNIRYFPSWYKPHSLNYHGYGYQIFFVVVLVAANIIVTFDYNKRKGRQKAKRIYNPFSRETIGKGLMFAKERIAAGDPEWTKFLKPPPE